MALTTIHLPVIEKTIRPGETIDASDLEAAGQTEEYIQALVDEGALGREGDDLHPSSIIPDPTVPNIELVVQQAKETVAELEAKGEDVPDDLRAVADLDTKHITMSDKGESSDSTA
jgi:hypothetical protein